jgi:lysophospholipase L1-like esterase
VTKRWLKIPLAVLGSAVAILLLAELAASFTLSGKAAMFIEDEQLYLVRMPDHQGYTWGNGRWIACHINALGLRGEDLPPARDPEEVRVLCLGDSFTFGSGVEEDESWPLKLQAQLGEPGSSGVRVLNGGANGWDTGWQRLYLEVRGLADVDPDVVVVGWNWNDLNSSPNAGPDAVKHFIYGRGGLLAIFPGWSWIRDTHLYRWVYTREVGTARVPRDAQMRRQLDHYRETMRKIAIQPELKRRKLRISRFGEDPPDERFWLSTDSAGWKFVRGEIGRMHEVCREAGVTLVFAMLPEPSWAELAEFPARDRLAAILDGLGVPWVDLQPDFVGRGWDSAPDRGLWQRYDPVHPNTKGHELIARRVAELLGAEDLISKRP